MNGTPAPSQRSLARACAALCVSGALAALAGHAAAARLTFAASHTFDADAEGWTVFGEAQGPMFETATDRHAGYISAADPEGSTGTSYWDAPDAFLENLPGALDGKLSYEVRSVGAGTMFSDPDVVVQGGGNVLEYRHKRRPKGRRWSRFSLKLNGARGWKNGLTGRQATRTLMENALLSADSLLIRGEFRNGPETFDLDNVVLKVRGR